MTTPTRATTRLRELLRRPGPILAPGATTALFARMIERAGFDAVYMTGAGTVGTLYGLPDTGLISVTEMVDNAARMAEAINIPLIADADTGYGNATNVFRTVRSYERAGVAGIHLEDQIFPKKCGHLLGKRLIPKEEMVYKIKAALDARRDPDFVIISRCDALLVNGLEDAIDRGQAYEAAGADLIFIESPLSMDHLRVIAKSFSAPLLLNVSSSGKTPLLNVAEIEELGFKIAIYPNYVLLAGLQAMTEVLHDLKRTGDVRGILDRTMPFTEFVDLAGLPVVQEQERKYGMPEEVVSRL